MNQPAPKLNYLNFDLLIERRGEKYRACLLDAPGGAGGEVVFSLPFNDLELENFLLKVGRPRRGLRALDSDEMKLARAWGERLFGALMGEALYGCYCDSLASARGRGLGLRLRLKLNAPELNDLPWEYLCDPGGDFLSLSNKTPIVRFLESSQPLQPPAAALPLVVLVMISSPTDYPSLDVEAEWRRLQTSLRPLIKRGAVALERLDRATLPTLQRRLRGGKVHIFHYIGHGGFDAASQSGLLVFEDENGYARRMNAQVLGTLLHDHESLRLAVLNACEGARTGKADPFTGAAQFLLRRGLPAVIAMQFEITDQAAIIFSHEFYTALADGYPVDAALSEARKAIFAQGNDIEWGTPVLLLRGDGRLFDLSLLPPAAAPARPLVPPLAEAPKPKAPPAGAQDTGPRPAPKASVRREVPPATSKPAAPRRVPAWLWLTGGLLALIVLCGLALLGQSIWGSLFAATPTVEARATDTVAPAPLLPSETFAAPEATPTATPTETPSPTPTHTPMPTISPSATPWPALITDARGVPMALIPAGAFQMGSETGNGDEKPVHTVNLGAFYMDVYEATNARYQECVQAGVCSAPSNSGSYGRASYYGNAQFAEYPVLYVSWNDAKTYCEWRGARLPTEAEWEKAARGGLEGKLYPWGDEIDCAKANYNYSCIGDTSAVGSYAPNGYGLYDMAGNVWEWAADWYAADYYANSPADNPTGPASGEFRALRGGSWYFNGSTVRASNRFWYDPSVRNSSLGFRCAFSP